MVFEPWPFMGSVKHNRIWDEPKKEDLLASLRHDLKNQRVQWLLKWKKMKEGEHTWSIASGPSLPSQNVAT